MLQTEFNLLSTKHTVNLMNRSRQKIYEHGEKTGHILAHQLRQKAASQSIPEIKDDLNVKYTNHSQINQTFCKFYSKLYSSESMKNESFLKKAFLKRLKSN